MDGTEAQRQIALGQKIITDAVPDAQVRSFALPLGAWPTPRKLAWQGSWGGIDYRMRGVYEVGAEPSQSPFAKAFDDHAIPRSDDPAGCRRPGVGQLVVARHEGRAPVRLGRKSGAGHVPAVARVRPRAALRIAGPPLLTRVM
jgi:hypothetical protein